MSETSDTSQKQAAEDASGSQQLGSAPMSPTQEEPLETHDSDGAHRSPSRDESGQHFQMTRTEEGDAQNLPSSPVPAQPQGQPQPDIAGGGPEESGTPKLLRESSSRHVTVEVAEEPALVFPDPSQCRAAAPEEYEVFPGRNKSLPPAPLVSQAGHSLAFTLFALFIMTTGMTFVLWRMPDPKTNPQLPDLGFDLLGKPMLELEHVTDLCLWIGNLSLVIVVFFLSPWRQYSAVKSLESRGLLPEGYSLGFDTIFEKKYIVSDNVYANTRYASFLRSDRNLGTRIFVRYAQTYGTTVLIRIVSNLLTSLPTPNNHCINPPEIKRNVFAVLVNALIGVATFGSANKHCGDLLFSGHTIVLTSSFMACWIYGPKFASVIRPLVACSFVFSWFTMLKSRSHYSDDIYIAAYITGTTFLLMNEYVGEKMRYFCYPYSPRRSMRKE